MAKYLDLDGLTAYDKKIKEWIKSGIVDITDDSINALFAIPYPANNEIWYTSTDGNVVTPKKTDVFGANIVSNTYEDGKGVIKFDNSVTSIGGYVFDGCSGLTSVTIPNSVTSIGDRAFQSCSSLTSITIPNSVTSIGVGAFFECSSLTSITIPNSVTSIGGYVFNYCSGLTSIVVEEGNTMYDSRENCNAIIKTATNTLIAGCNNTTIPNSVTGIGEYAFAYCSKLPPITIPNSVTSIGNRAFIYCTKLTSITIPNSVTSIGRSAFWNCRSLTFIIFDGTMEEWNSITKGIEWNKYVPATYIQCSDGQVTL